MAVLVDELNVTYCEGWNPVSRSTVGLLSEETAAERDRHGEQYAVLLSTDRPRLLLEIAWRQGYCGLWLFDAQGRRTERFDYRRLAEGRVFLRETSEWRYDSAEQAEFDARAWTVRRRFNPDGSSLEVLAPKGEYGGSTHTWPKVDADQLWSPVPAFGEWTFADKFDPDISPSVGLRVTVDPQAPELPVAKPPWRPPTPLRPSRLESMFQPEARLTVPDMGEVVIEVRSGGTLVMPTGRLTAADPGWLDSGLQPFTVEARPGEYDVSLAVVRCVDDPEHVRVAGVKLIIQHWLPSSWEPALRPGQDPRLLGEGEFYGFSVDTGMGCLLDASAIEALTVVAEENYDEICDRVSQHAAAGFDAGSGVNCVAFLSGWGDGSYPVWIGRDAEGEVVCFVADMLLLADDAAVTPEAMG
ncbi:DUF4241 domain-containing protein [Acrocarpospora macrocephala]|uniref:DUF4241 domain-containing protein n=1 Tax=Acrocarpospora macrocephala TaxID=150177 RepID=A0A5M3WUZ2_9ACTN|nr:DUF4241 domain-containing protein [Acrocarpospora macrocephala]GES12704.1 hypothetical protein Amac_063010 [Acrocarpospora macrocephala]